jgi:hypothetical protein
MNRLALFTALLTTIAGGSTAVWAAAMPPVPRRAESTPPLNWQGSAKLQRSAGKTSGTLILNATGLGFRPVKGGPSKWPFEEIQTLDVGSRRLVLTSYERRGRLRLGVRHYRFDLQDGIPPGVIAALIEKVGKPARNRVPDPASPAFGSIQAHHHTPRGGSNGALRLRDGGVDYITSRNNDSRSWRWADIEVLSSLEPYHLVLSGRLETFSFELKEPLRPELFNRLWDEVYAHRSPDLRSGGRIQP